MEKLAEIKFYFFRLGMEDEDMLDLINSLKSKKLTSVYFWL